jgi:hypothetical protein
MGLRCKNCNSTNTIVLPKKEIEKHQGEIGASGFINQITLLTLLKEILELIISILDKIFKNQERYVVCKDCGYYEKL